MNDFGPKRPVCDGENNSPSHIEKKKRGRPKKKPGYDRAEIIDELLMTAVELFAEPYDDRVTRSKDAPTLLDVANAMNTTPLKVRKLLITAGYYSTQSSREVQELHEAGYDLQAIMVKTGLKKASVNGYLPYSKGVYLLSDPTLRAEQCRLFRARKKACERLKEALETQDEEQFLWEAIVAFANYPFTTEKGLQVKYTVKGGEVFFDRKEKSVTRASVMIAFHQARKIQKEEGCVSGPKRLGTFGASYLYPVFLRIGVCKKI